MMEHNCEQLAKANSHIDCDCHFTLNDTQGTWCMWNNDDDYYAPPYITFCPFCGEELDK